ncbi:MAG TPA: ATP-binding protein, partial [Fibrobacteria bacterium]|nr:ATP-binding protein [Fibrobacteria bacterium]
TGGVGIWDYDISTGRLVWDDQMFKLYGIAPDSFVAAYDTWRNGVHPDDRERADAEIQMAIRGEKEFDTEFRVVWPDGSVHHIRAISFLDRDGNGAPLRLVGTNWDITREKESEEALRQSEKKISQLLQTTDQGIYGIDAEGNCTFVNRSGLQMLGYSLEECLGRKMHRLIHHSHPDGSPYLWQTCPIFRSGLDGGGCRLDTEVFWRKDGSSIPVEYSSHPVVVDGTIEGSVVTFSDITARKEAESALLASNDELQEATMRANEMAVRAEMANAAKGEFLANMSHEIRTPMNGVLGLTGLLLDTDLDKDQRRFAETIRQSAESLLSLINDILDFSKIEAGKLELERLDFDLREMVSDLSSSLSPRVQDKGLELRHRIDPEVPDRLLGDSGRLRQILLNLLSNAIKFTHRGSITLEAKLDEESAGDVLLRFAVRDTGIGIPQDKQALLFQKFSQVDASTTRQFGGTGLGLAISKQLAELMGGQIGVISREGVGTEFWFTVRMARSTAAPPADKPLEIPVDLGELRHRSVRILLAEDNITNQMVAMGILERLGLRVDAVANGEEAVHALEQFPYDLVLMDVQMPEMDGLTATRRIRDRHSPVLDHNIPVIAMTANAMQGDRERCLAAGMDDYVPKPVSPQALAAALDKWLPRSGDPKTDSVMPAASPPPAIPRPTVVFDWPGLVERMLGQESLAQKILRSSMTQIPGQASTLLERMETGNLPEIKRLAHALKGAVANLGGEEIRLEMESLERQAGEADIASIQGNVERLGKRFAALFAQMEAHLRP